MRKIKIGEDFNAATRDCLTRTFKPHLALLIFYVFLSLLQAVMIAIFTKVRAIFIDEVLDLQHSTEEIISLFFLNVCIVFLVQYGLPMLQSYFNNLISQRIYLSVEYRVHKKKSTISWECHEDEDINNKIKLLEDAANHIWLYVKGMIGILATVISIIGMFSIIIQLGRLFALVLVMLYIPVVYYAIRAATNYYDTWRRTAKLRRNCDYQRNILMDKEYAAERILFEYTPFFLNRWEKDYKEVRNLSIKEELKGSKKMQIAGILFCLYVSVVVCVLANKLSKGEITAGYMVALVSVFPPLMNSMIVLLSNQINEMVRAKQTVKTLVAFERIEDDEGALALPQQNVDFSEIVFHNVSFQYPGTTKWVLRRVNMRFEKGKHYAVVGENGAGKSTLIKLLLRLYRVTEGEILLDGVNINDVPRTKLRGLMSALFQDHQNYYTNISENIGIGDINNLNHTCRIEDSARKAGIHKTIAAMPDGYQTVLGTMHESGVELSGGEWQKLAISRLMMSPCLFKILDEPTAAMDPLFESVLYQDFNSIMRGKTTVLISHRLASCKSADYIYVLNHGCISEQGSHKSLMERKRHYYKMYTTQKDMYQ